MMAMPTLDTIDPDDATNVTMDGAYVGCKVVSHKGRWWQRARVRTIIAYDPETRLITVNTTKWERFRAWVRTLTKTKEPK